MKKWVSKKTLISKEKLLVTNVKNKIYKRNYRKFFPYPTKEELE